MAERIVLKRVTQGVVKCFEPGSKEAYCEASAAVALDDGGVLFFGDKPSPKEKNSSFIYAPSLGGSDTATAISMREGELTKIESASSSGDFIFVAASFDRVSDEFDSDNRNKIRVFAKPSSATESLSLVATLDDWKGFRSEISTRVSEMMGKDGAVPYFKMEGMAVRGDRLVFGIREAGNSFSDFSYGSSMISAAWKMKDGKLSLTDWKNELDLKVSLSDGEGLSDISVLENALLATVSKETENAVSGRMVSVDESGESDVLDADTCRPLVFANKPEGVSVGKNGLVAVVFDDDRMETEKLGLKRKLGEAAVSTFQVDTKSCRP